MSYGKQCSVGVNKWWEKTENFFFFRFQPPPRLRVDEIRSKVGKKREANKAGCTKVDFPTMRRNMDLPDYCTVRARGLSILPYLSARAIGVGCISNVGFKWADR